jgi:hypothetical protein
MTGPRRAAGRTGRPRRAAGGAARLLVLAALGICACRGPGQVRFDRESCFVDGQRAGLQEVEEREAVVQRRIATRQPWLVAITVMVVVLAGGSYAERLLLLFSARRDTRTMGDRVKAIVTRYRAHPVRYFALVAGSVGLLFAAGIVYIYLDADKRGSERALATLQFCHLALRTADEKRTLDDQRRNLASIHDTAGAIRQLIDKLPPAEQVKAQEIIGHMDDAVGRQGRFLADRFKRSEDATASIRDGTLSIARDLSGLESEVGGLKELPAGVRAVADGLRAVEARGAAAEKSVGELGARLGAVEKALDALASRPAPACPSCVCGDRDRTLAAVAPRPHPDGGAN